MNIRIPAFVAATAVGAALILSSTLPAFADDSPPPDPTATVVTPAPTDDSTPAATDDSTPAPTDDASTPPADPAPAATAPDTVAPSYVIVAWAMPSWINSTTPSWPQTYETSLVESTPDLSALDSQLTKCGTQHQVDIYNAGETTTSLIAGKHLDGPNNPAEDLIAGGWGTAYKLIHNDVCPQPCVATGTSYTEDVDWTDTAAGEVLTGQTSAVDHYYGVTGNLQGLPSLSITETTTGSTTESALAVVEVNPHGPAYPGGPSITYETLTPLGPNADGTTNELTGLLYSSKIPYATTGGQGSPQPLAWFIANQPNNTLISVGVHFQTSGVGTSTVTALEAGCVSQIYVTPPVVTPPATPVDNTTVLAETGTADAALIPVGLGLLILGIGALVFRRRFI
jgi:LPXTG-motif cell wall-anchored protein